MTRLLFVPLLLASLCGVGQSADPTLPPANQRVLLTLQGVGAQVYGCRSTPRGFAWVFEAPAARLFDAEGKEVGTHGDGPTWTLDDASSVSGLRVAEAPSTEPGSIPSLLLKAANPRRQGLLTAVEYIRRLNPKGGAAPGSGCDGSHEGEQAHVPYTATYLFYSSQPGT